jgi:4-azaleucine resistance transporter AzlC
MATIELARTTGAGARAILPLTPAVAAFGLTFGVLASEAGFDALSVVVFSATTFAGSAQFAAMSVLSAGGTAAAAVLAAVLLNTRYVPIGISVAPALDGPAWKRFLRAQLVVDESWVTAHLGGGRYDPSRLVGAGLVLYGTWVLSSGVGVAAGDVMGDPETLGLDVAFPALFLALLAGQTHGRRAIVAAALGATIAFVLIPFVPAGVPIVAAAAACLIGLRPPAGQA